MERRDAPTEPQGTQAGDTAGEGVPAGHHMAAPEVEEWAPHPYEGEGLHRRESLKADQPEPAHEASGGA
ncbi:hypothetical protein HT031_003788 [Scenedesmus sp. PABB004]|nr:hypothetical protein HT031_003788 [Scenedesmus sp. PABB004]